MLLLEDSGIESATYIPVASLPGFRIVRHAPEISINSIVYSSSSSVATAAATILLNYDYRNHARY